MEEVIIGIFVIVIIIFALTTKNQKKKTKKHQVAIPNSEGDMPDPIKPDPIKSINQQGEEASQEKDWGQEYRAKWLFSQNEKNAYRKLQAIAEEKNMIVFAKVRLIDLVEPKSQSKYNKTNFYKIQAKHVDFVICTNNLVAKYIIEIDDNSHITEKRKERDKFVDTVLTSCGYKVLRIKGVQEEDINKFLV